MSVQPKILQPEGYALMGAAFEVYNEQGYGMAEEIYQESLEMEFEMRKIHFRTKPELTAYYKGRPLQRRYIPDFLVYGQIVAELKAVAALLPEHEAQLFNYMRITRTPVGYLINFGQKNKLEWKRYILTDTDGAAKVVEG